MSLQTWITSVYQPRRRSPRNSRKMTHRTRPSLESLDDRLLLSTLMVTNNSDSYSTGSLRSEISAAAPGDTIEFDASLNGATISLTGNPLNLTNNLTIDATTLSSGVTLQGHGSVHEAILTVYANVTLAGLTFTGGQAYNGGGIYNNGTLTMQDCTLSGNNAESYFVGGIRHGGDGGGIYNLGTLTMQDCTLSGNGANDGGGGIYNLGTLTMQNSTLSANVGEGGGIYNRVGIVTVQNSTLSGNVALDGGGINNNGGIVTVQDSTLSGNQSNDVGGGGGIYNGGGLSDLGGGWYGGGILTVQNSTLSGNEAAITGGGIRNEFGSTVTVQNSTVSANTSSTYVPYFGGYYLGSGAGISNRGVLNLGNTIVAGNTSGYMAPDIFGTVVSQGHNLIGDTSGITSSLVASDLQNVVAGLDPNGLQNHGGPTETIALLPGSPAINAGDNTIATGAGLTTDQRGTSFARVVGNTVDIGAFEAAVSVTSPTVTTVIAAGGTYDGVTAFAATVTVTGSGTITGSPTVDYFDNTTSTDLGSTAPINAGNYTVTATYAGDATHSGSTASVKMTISPKLLAATALSQGTINIGSNGSIVLNIGIAPGQLYGTDTIASLFNGATFTIGIQKADGSVTYGTLTSTAHVETDGSITVTMQMNDTLRAELYDAYVNGGAVNFSMSATANGGNYMLDEDALSRLLNKGAHKYVP